MSGLSKDCGGGFDPYGHWLIHLPAYRISIPENHHVLLTVRTRAILWPSTCARPHVAPNSTVLVKHNLQLKPTTMGLRAGFGGPLKRPGWGAI